MTKQIINIGIANKGNGDPIRTAFDKVNQNFTELYNAIGLGDGSLNIGAFEFTGSTMTTTDSSDIIIAQRTQITSNLTVAGDILPSVANGGDLGSAAKPWSSLYVSNSTIYFGSTPLSLDPNTNELKINNVPVSQTINYEDIPNVPTDVSDLTDTQGLLGGGNANTGDVTFDGVKVIGAGTASGDGSGYSTLELVPDNDLYGNHQYLVIDPTAPSHIHIRAGGTQDNSNAELFLGGEKNYLRVRDNSGSVRMQTQTLQETGFFSFNTTLGFVSATWQSDGNGGYQVFMIDVTPELYNAISNSNSDSFIQLIDGTNYYTVTSTGMTPAVGAVVFGVVQAPDGGGPINIVEINITNFTLRTNYAELNGPDFTVNVYDDVRITGEDVVSIRNRSTTDPITIITDWNDSERTWSFGSNGDLSLPQDGGIVFDRNNTTIRVGMGFHIASGEGISLDAIDQTDPNNLVYKSWGFAPTGILTLPAGGDIVDSTGTSVLGGGLSGDYDDLTDKPTSKQSVSPGGGPGGNNQADTLILSGLNPVENIPSTWGGNLILQSGVGGANSDLYGEVRVKSGTVEWEFSTDGKLYLPSIGGGGGAILRSPLNESIGISAYNDTGAGTTYTLSVATTGPINIPTASTGLGRLQNADGIEILTNSGETAKLWAFGDDGNLTLPNNSQIRVDGNNVEVGGMTNFNVEALGVVNVYTNDGAHQWQFGDDGNMTFPGGATVKDLPGEGPDDSVLILGAGTTIAENQRAARIGINGSVAGVSIGAGTNDWTFTNDGTLTLPGYMTIDTEYGGTTRLVIDGNANKVEIRSNDNILIGYNDSFGNVFIGNPGGGGQVDILGSKFRVLVDAPASSLGSLGDQQGQVAFDGSYIYYCTQNFGGTTYNVVHMLGQGLDANGVDNGYLVADSYQLPQVGWTVYYNGETRTIDQVNNTNPGFYIVFVSSPLTIPGQAQFAWGPPSVTNIWKRVAWSGDTW